jgi:hypothetical protein
LALLHRVIVGDKKNMAVTVRQAIDWLLKCSAESELRIYFPNEDFSDAVETIQEDVDEEVVYLCGFPTSKDIHGRTVSVINFEVNTAEGHFLQVQKFDS